MKSALTARDWRYVRVRLHHVSIDDAGLRNELNRYFASFFGALGMAEVQPGWMARDDSILILRAARGQEMKLCAALALLSRLAGRPARLQPLSISGTIKSLRERSPPSPPFPPN